MNDHLLVWQEGDELCWLQARFPNDIASHSKEQDFYFGDDFLFSQDDVYYRLCCANGVGNEYLLQRLLMELRVVLLQLP